jgi:ketosteroid isomerase-like protein
MAKANIHTVPHPDGWANRREGSKRVSKVFKTKAEAQAAGRRTAKRERIEHLVQTRDGKISERNSYGGDPARVKD